MAGADRLPLGVVPSAYRLRIEPDLDAARFDGVVEIDVALDAPSATIELHALELSLPRAAARLEGGERRQAVVTLDPATERAALTFEPGLPAGRAVLELAFAGTLNDQLAGFYRSTFTDLDGAAHTIATTQLCETDARRMFPCFDEPAFKATFEVTVVVPAPLRAFSNAPVQTTRTLEGGRREIAFRRTMPMSTYLVALVVGPFEQTAPVDVDGVPLTVVCTPGRTDLGRFALEVGAFALRFYAEYFGIPYPGEKVDLVAVPDFAYGAMENLGCITFRESVLLVDEQTASAAELQQVAMVVAHELAHMWFGDLVTMAWWEGIWLNEAFATQMQYLCADAFRPQWRLWGEFARDREFGLEIDALHTTRSIEFPVSSPADATGMLDAITYLKGATVLRMLEEFLGADVYRAGVRRYLEDHEYANAVTADLWRAFEAASGEPVAEVMGTWILQGGHPVVTAANGSLSQAPFAYRPPDGPSAIGRGWRVPVRSRPLAGGPAAAQLLGDEPEPVAAATPAVVNAGGLAAYRTAYDAETFGALVARLDALTELERGTLLGDTWALARAGARPVADVLAVARALDPVAEPRAWATVLGVLDLLDRIVDERDRPQLQTAASALFAPLLTAFGWDAEPGEDVRTGTVRATAVEGLGVLARDASVRAEAAARFEAGALTGDLAPAIVTVVAATAAPGVAEVLLARYRAAPDPQAEDRYRTGLADLADRAHGLETLAHCFEWFRTHDASSVIGRLVANRVAGPSVWEAVAASWDDTIGRIPPALQFRVTMGVPSLVGDAALAERVAAFHRSHPIAIAQRTVDQQVERMRNGVAFAERVRPELGAALAAVA